MAGLCLNVGIASSGRKTPAAVESVLGLPGLASSLASSLAVLEVGENQPLWHRLKQIPLRYPNTMALVVPNSFCCGVLLSCVHTVQVHLAVVLLFWYRDDTNLLLVKEGLHTRYMVRSSGTRL